MRQDSKKARFLRWGVIGLALSAMVALPMFVLTGCGGSPVESPSISLQSEESFWAKPFDPADEPTDGLSLAAGNFTTYEGVGEATVGGGGTIQFDMPGSIHELYIKRNTLSEDVTIAASISIHNRQSGNLVLFDFSPDGLTFSRSVILRFDIVVLSKKSKNVDLYWLNPATNKWEYQDSVKANGKGIIEFPIDHFSMYGVE